MSRWAEVNIRNNHSSGGVPATILIEERASSSGARWRSAAMSAVGTQQGCIHPLHACSLSPLNSTTKGLGCQHGMTTLGLARRGCQVPWHGLFQRWLGGQCCGCVHLGGRHSVRQVTRDGNCGLPSNLALWSPIWAISPRTLCMPLIYSFQLVKRNKICDLKCSILNYCCDLKSKRYVVLLAYNRHGACAKDHVFLL